MTTTAIELVKEKMVASIEALKRELTKIRTGRATLSLLDDIRVNAYGSPMSLDKVSALTIPESNMIAIKPWDPQMMAAIEKAILASDLGLTPNNDGNVIRLIIPPLTEARRKELVKHVRKLGEEHKVAVRNLRRDMNESLKKLKKDKALSEDELFRQQEDAQKVTDGFIAKIDEIVSGKEKDVMAV